MNKVILIGNLTKDPEQTSTPTGISICKFSIAVQRKFNNANGEKEVDFIPIITWRGLADNCGKYLFKGSKVSVVGSLQIRTYEDKNEDKRYIAEVIAEEVEFLSSKANEATTPHETAKKGTKKSITELEPIENEDLPF